MIKTGDKVICIRKDYINLSYVNSELDLTIGESYIVELVMDRSIQIKGWVFGKNEKDDTFLRYFKDYFTTIAELREQQIKSVIDD